jgi:hypothetical protein
VQPKRRSRGSVVSKEVAKRITLKGISEGGIKGFADEINRGERKSTWAGGFG